MNIYCTNSETNQFINRVSILIIHQLEIIYPLSKSENNLQLSVSAWSTISCLHFSILESGMHRVNTNLSLYQLVYGLPRLDLFNTKLLEYSSKMGKSAYYFIEIALRNEKRIFTGKLLWDISSWLFRGRVFKKNVQD